MYCKECGKEIKDNAVVCIYCGVGVTEKEDLKSRTIYIILALFLGALGIHNFYAGHNKRGIIQLILTIGTCGLGAIPVSLFVLCEIFTVKKDAKGVLMPLHKGIKVRS